MMKKRIFIAMHYMELGGAETALIGLLNALNPDRVVVDLFLYDQRGEMMQFIPEWVNLLPIIPKYTVLERPVVELVKRGFWDIAVARLWAKCVTKIAYHRSRSSLENYGGLDKMSMYTTPLLPKVNPSIVYDLAISFLTPHRIVLDKVQAKKKIAWIHTDYTKVWVDIEEELKVWERYDYIASISTDVTKTFIKTFPTLASKIVEIENILSPAFVRTRADFQDVRDEICDNNTIAMLSIGRYTHQKNFDDVPDICRRINCQLSIVNCQFRVKWFLIGFGGDEALIREKIEEEGMQDYVIILGKRTNPYPYIKACDIYVQPSRYEGKSVTVREAQMLCKPVVVTNYPTASSQIQDAVDGVIVPMDNEECAKGILEFILDEQKQNQIVKYLQNHDYGNMAEIEKLYRLM